MLFRSKAMVFLNKQDDSFIKQCKELYFESLNCVYQIFGKYAFRRISKLRQQDLKPINTALFEGWLNGVANLSSEERALLLRKKDDVKSLYIEELDKKSSFYSDIGSGKYRSFIRRNETIQKMIEEVLSENRQIAIN